MTKRPRSNGEWLDIGKDTLIRRSEVIAATSGASESDIAKMHQTMTVYEDQVEGVLVLRDGRLAPFYYRFATIKKHLFGDFEGEANDD